MLPEWCGADGPEVRAAGRSIGLHRHPGRPRLDQRQVVRLAELREQRQPVAHHDGVERQVELVDEIVLEQPPEQFAAAIELELAPGRRLELGTAASTRPR